MSYSNLLPTITQTTCASATNCPQGSVCTQNATCGAQMCCGSVLNENSAQVNAVKQAYQGQWFMSGRQMIVINQTVYQNMISVLQLGPQLCLGNYMDSMPTKSYYVTGTQEGSFTFSNNTSVASTYSCNQTIILNPSYNPYTGILPTVNTQSCSSGSNCAAGSTCSSDSQCAAGNCCAYPMSQSTANSILGSGKSLSNLPQGNTATRVNATHFQANSNSTFNYLNSNVYYPYRVCAGNVNGNSSTSYYNSTGLYGAYANGSNSFAMTYYSCQNYFIQAQAQAQQGAMMLETIQAIVLAAFSLVYLNLA